MKHRRIQISAVTLICTMIFSGIGLAAEVKDFAEFDRAFIPPLALTQAEQAKPAKQAMSLLMPAWRRLKDQFAVGMAGADSRSKDFNRIDQLIEKAGAIVDEGQNLLAAHETLESVRMILADMRRRENIAYFPDRLTEFHEHMENLYHSGAGVSPEELDENAIFALDMSYKEAIAIWQKVRDTPFNYSDYGFDEEQGRRAEKLVREEDAALLRLKSALQGKDNTEIIEAAKGVKPKYAALYKMFGDFDKVAAK